MFWINLRATTMPASQAAILADTVVARRKEKTTKIKIGRFNKLIAEALKKGERQIQSFIREDGFDEEYFINHFKDLGYFLDIIQTKHPKTAKPIRQMTITW